MKVLLNSFKITSTKSEARTMLHGLCMDTQSVNIANLGIIVKAGVATSKIYFSPEPCGYCVEYLN